MEEAESKNGDFVVMLVDDDPDVLGDLVRDLGKICGTAMEIVACESYRQAMDTAVEYVRKKIRIPLVIADHLIGEYNGADLLIELHDMKEFRPTCKALLSADHSLDDVKRALNRGALNRSLTKPWKFNRLRKHVRDLLTEYFIRNVPEEIDRFPNLIDIDRLSHAFVDAEHDLREMETRLKTVQRSFLSDSGMSDEEAVQAMLKSLDAVMDNPPRLSIKAGTALITQGNPVDGVSILLDGKISLARKVGGREVAFQQTAAGSIIGLLSLTRAQKAFFSCVAVTDLTVVNLTFVELEKALQESHEFSVHFITNLIRSLAWRNRKVAELKLALEDLNMALSEESSQLKRTLKKLETVQMKLVEAEKMATLGQVSAGIAHELNNPIAAIERAVEYISEDIFSLLKNRDDSGTFIEFLNAPLESKPISTRKLREIRNKLTEDLGDEQLARRLVKIGVKSLDEYNSLLLGIAPGEHEKILGLAERYYKLGTSLRNITHASERVASIVKSLRSYTRGDASSVANVDIREGIDDTLVLLGHKIKNISIKKDYQDIPRIECHVGEINQVWTNILANALEAMGEEGVLIIRVDSPDAKHIRVKIIDNGPGISPGNMKKIYDLNFTTKEGEADFGIGFGLPISREIIQRHNGRVIIESGSDGTTVTVILPVEMSK